MYKVRGTSAVYNTQFYTMYSKQCVFRPVDTAQCVLQTVYTVHSFAESPEWWNLELQQAEIFADSFRILADNNYIYQA